MVQNEKSDSHGEGKQGFAAPTISLPKGGGAIGGIEEKLAASPVTALAKNSSRASSTEELLNIPDGRER
jgi:hypothetical protein